MTVLHLKSKVFLQRFWSSKIRSCTLLLLAEKGHRMRRLPMSSENYPALKLDLVPSRIILASLFAGHLLALIAVGLLVLPLACRFGLAGLIVVSLIHACRRSHSVYNHGFIGEIRCSDGGWLLCTASGEARPARLLASYVHPWLVILRFNSDTVVIAPDSTEPAQLRRLRMRLLIAKEENADAEPPPEFWRANR